MPAIRHLLLIIPLLWAGLAHGSDAIAYLLNSDSPPPGVVFEVAEGDDDALEWAIPQVRDYVTRLRARHPQLEMALVTHGKEQFALQTKRQGEHAAIHQGVQSLLGDQVPVHVCGTHAGWYGVAEEDFPAYVDVAPAGPTQIHNYEELGWAVIRVEAPER